MFIEIAVGIAVLAASKKFYDKTQRDNLLRLTREAEEAKAKALEGVSVTVFVREPNGSKTNLEYHIEQELIGRGAHVLMADQQAGTNLVKQGVFQPLHPEALFSFVGTLVVRSGLSIEGKEWTESEHDFESRQADFEVLMRSYQESRSWGDNVTRPILEERRYKIVRIPAILYQLSFRVVGRDGTLLASGTSEKEKVADQGSDDSILRKLSKDAIGYLDDADVWSKAVI
ncbi:hypothetical protein KW796_03015 [Candidatus Parcubacteria bacterium]|nr:hypothetical protein [Candidatus Parcubacteria bacterium]